MGLSQVSGGSRRVLEWSLDGLGDVFGEASGNRVFWRGFGVLGRGMGSEVGKRITTDHTGFQRSSAPPPTLFVNE